MTPRARPHAAARSARPRQFDWEGARQRMAAVNAALEGLDETAAPELERVWARRASLLAQEAAPEESGELIELVLVRLGHDEYGIEARHVFDIKPAGHVTRVPRAPEWVTGVVAIRGRILSVIDLPRFLGLPAPTRPDDNSSYLVVVEDGEMELALLTGTVLTIATVAAGRIQPVDETMVLSLPTAYVRGVVEQRDAGLWVVLDIPALLGDKRLIVQEEI